MVREFMRIRMQALMKGEIKKMLASRLHAPPATSLQLGYRSFKAILNAAASSTEILAGVRSCPSLCKVCRGSALDMWNYIVKLRKACYLKLERQDLGDGKPRKVDTPKWTAMATFGYGVRSCPSLCKVCRGYLHLWYVRKHM